MENVKFLSPVLPPQDSLSRIVQGVIVGSSRPFLALRWACQIPLFLLFIFFIFVFILFYLFIFLLTSGSILIYWYFVVV